MRRYGKRLDRGYTDEVARSNRGRARTAATGNDRSHANAGRRTGQEQTAAIRSRKKALRLEERLDIADALFDHDLAQYDPEVWLHGKDLTAFKDTVPKRRPPLRAIQSTWDWDLSDAYAWNDVSRDLYDTWDDTWDVNDTWDVDARDQHLYDAWYDEAPDSPPEPGDCAWRDLWVAGVVQAPEALNWHDWHADHYNRDHYEACDDFDHDEDGLPDWQTPLPATDLTIEASSERNLEKLRAGERYFRQTGRAAPASTQRDAERSLTGPAWLVTRARRRVNPKAYRHLIAKKADEYPAFKAPSKYTWDLIKNVPLYELEVSFDHDSVAEDQPLKCHRFEKPWTIIVDQDGKILHGHHRIAALAMDSAVQIDVLWIRPRS